MTSLLLLPRCGPQSHAAPKEHGACHRMAPVPSCAVPAAGNEEAARSARWTPRRARAGEADARSRRRHRAARFPLVTRVTGEVLKDEKARTAAPCRRAWSARACRLLGGVGFTPDGCPAGGRASAAGVLRGGVLAGSRARMSKGDAPAARDDVWWYDVSEVPIPMDEVDEADVAQPRSWDMRFVRDFMWTIGPVSSLFDFATFAVLLAWLHAHEALFQTGWFVESMATQVLVIFVIRTRGPPLRSVPSQWLATTSIAVVAIAGCFRSPRSVARSGSSGHRERSTRSSRR